MWRDTNTGQEERMTNTPVSMEEMIYTVRLEGHLPCDYFEP